MSKYLQNLQKLIEWTHENLHKDAKVLINFRDMMDVMLTHPERVFETATFLCKLPAKIKLFGLVFEDSGKSVPEAIGSCTRFLRKVMDDNKHDGHLLTHVHEKFGYKDASSIEVNTYNFQTHYTENSLPSPQKRGKNGSAFLKSSSKTDLYHVDKDNHTCTKQYIREDAYSRSGGIFIRDTARDTAYSL